MKRFFVALLLLAVPILAAAQHRVARIEVNSRVPARILLSQSALVEGRTYTDADLDVAVARLRRLAFVYDARYRLDGETLILDVEAMSRLFGEVDAQGSGIKSESTGAATFTGGGRLFLNSGGVAEVNAREHVNEYDDAQSLAAEYSHYGIGGSRLFATAGIEQVFYGADDVDVDPQFHLTVGYPLTLRSTITSTIATAGFSSRSNVPVAVAPLRSSSDQKSINLLWTYDTSDDPFFARHGLLVSAGPSYTDDKSSFDSLFVFNPPTGSQVVRFRSEGSSTEIAANATKYWPFRERGTFFGTLRAAYNHQEFETRTDDSFPLPGEVDSQNYALAVGYGHNLFDWTSPLGTTRQRLEFTLGTVRSSFERDDGFFFDEHTLDAVSATASYVLRRQFATVRLNLSYTVD